MPSPLCHVRSLTHRFGGLAWKHLWKPLFWLHRCIEVLGKLISKLFFQNRKQLRKKEQELVCRAWKCQLYRWSSWLRDVTLGPWQMAFLLLHPWIRQVFPPSHWPVASDRACPCEHTCARAVCWNCAYSVPSPKSSYPDEHTFGKECERDRGTGQDKFFSIENMTEGGSKCPSS